MASTDKTDLLKLPQWQDNDKLEMTDLNDAFEKVDTGLTTHLADKATPDALGHIMLGAGLTSDANGKVSASGFKSLMFNRDISVAGNQYVEVGFKPRAVIFFATVPGSAGRISWGLDDGITPYAVASYHNITANANTVIAQSIRLYTSASVSLMGHISSFSTSGFTITWEKAGSPTGDAQVIALAIK